MLRFHEDKFSCPFRGRLREVQKELEISSAPEKSGVLSLIWAFLTRLKANLFSVLPPLSGRITINWQFRAILTKI